MVDEKNTGIQSTSRPHQMLLRFWELWNMWNSSCVAMTLLRERMAPVQCVCLAHSLQREVCILGVGALGAEDGPEAFYSLATSDPFSSIAYGRHGDAGFYDIMTSSPS